MDADSIRAGRPAWLAVIAAVVATLCLAGMLERAEAGTSGKRVCGVVPGDGAYSYYKTRNVSCKIARKVSRQAGRNFCGHRYRNCDTPPGGDPKTGRTKAKGWRCKMVVGYEFYRAKCKRRDMRFKHESAS